MRVRADEKVAALVPFRKPPRSLTDVSLAGGWHDRASVDKLKGRTAPVGASAPALVDLRPTPVGEVYPGVAVHANLIAVNLEGRVRQRPAWTLGPEIIVLLALGPPLAFLLPFLSPLKAALASVGALAGYADLSVAVWSNAGLFLPLASGLLLVIALFALDMSYGCFVESRSTRQFTELFESLTVLFADIRGGFTSNSETLEPKELARIINDYLTAMSLAIRGARGTLDKYMGDAMIAFRGAPVADPLHARQAVATALAMQAELRLWQQAIRYYRAQNWDQAKVALFNLQRVAPQDELYAVYARRVVALRAHPPGAGWDGVTTFDIK